MNEQQEQKFTDTIRDDIKLCTMAAETKARKEAETSRRHNTSYKQRYELAEIGLNAAVMEMYRMAEQIDEKARDCAIWRFGFVALAVIVIAKAVFI